MNKMQLVNNQETIPNQLPTYQGVKKDLEKRLTAAKNEFEFTKLISDVNTVLKSNDLSQKNKIDLRNFRQKIYDRKKRSQEINLVQTPFENIEKNHIETPSHNHQDASRFGQDALKNQKDFFSLSKNFNALNFFFIFKTIFSILLFGICTCLTALFVWKQSIPLYEAVGFPDPKFCALGAIMMIVGFATIHSLTKSKIALLLCLYASAYEIILITRGTLTHDSLQIQRNIENDTELSWLKEKAQYSEQLYRESKSNFDNPASKVFQNPWYNGKYVTPAWEKYSEDKNKVLLKLNQLNDKSNSHKDSLLKILFRLGLVFLCMVSVHNFLNSLNLDSFKIGKLLLQTEKELVAK